MFGGHLILQRTGTANHTAACCVQPTSLRLLTPLPLRSFRAGFRYLGPLQHTLSIIQYQQHVFIQAPSPTRSIRRRQRCTDRPRPPAPHRAHRSLHYRGIHSFRTTRPAEVCSQKTLSLLQKRQASKDCRLRHLRRTNRREWPTNNRSAQKHIHQYPAFCHGGRSQWPATRSLCQEQSTDEQ